MSGQNGNKTVGDSLGGDLWVVKIQPDIAFLKPLPAPRAGWGLNGFRFAVTAPPGLYAVDSSDHFFSWVPVQTNQLVTGPTILSFPPAINSAQRFYRLRAVQ